MEVNAQSFLPIYKRGSGSLEVDLKIGGDVDEEEYILNSPTSIAIDSKDNIFVLDYGDRCIKKYDKNGKHIITFSKEGQGPGEIEAALRMVIDSNDNIVIYDTRARRFSCFDNNGKFTNSIPSENRQYIYDFKLGLNNKFIILIRDLNIVVGDGTLYKISQKSVDLTNEIVIDSAKVLERKYNLQTRESKSYYFSPRLLMAKAPSGNILTAFTDEYKFKIYSPGLKLIKEVIHDRKRQKVTSKSFKAEVFF